MELMEVAGLQTMLEGVDLPATKLELARYAAAQGATRAQLGLLAVLREREFQTIDEVAECLLSVQPEYEAEVPHEPREESGAPPGGTAYTVRHPTSGAVRD